MSRKLPIGVVLPAGGAGLRLGASVPKQFIKLGNKTLIEYSLERFCHYPGIQSVVLVLPPGYAGEYTSISSTYTSLSVVTGGAERWQSVQNGVQALPLGVSAVLVHDVARPFLPNRVIDQCIHSALSGKNVVTAYRAVDTIKQVKGESIQKTLDRKGIIHVQTPQAFVLDHLKHVYQKLTFGDLPRALSTDEAGMLEHSGFPVSWIPGSPWLKKITTPDDILWAEWVDTLIQTGKVDLND